MTTIEPFILIELGAKRCDRSLLKAGLKFEIIDTTGDPRDGGPMAVAWCDTKSSADAVMHALKLAKKLAS